MWEVGCQSFVAMRRSRSGKERRRFIVEAIERPRGTAREPVGGQKSFWKSTIIRADFFLVAVLLMGEDIVRFRG